MQNVGRTRLTLLLLLPGMVWMPVCFDAQTVDRVAYVQNPRSASHPLLRTPRRTVTSNVRVNLGFMERQW